MQDRALNVTLLALAKNDQERWGSCVVIERAPGTKTMCVIYAEPNRRIETEGRSVLGEEAVLHVMEHR